jgi:phosphomannomutase
MAISRDIFKAYDVRGLYPGEINEDAARLIGRGFAAYLKAGRVAVSRDMRVSACARRAPASSITACAPPT